MPNFERTPINYAKDYLAALEQEFPYVLYFGALFSTPNNGRFRWVNSRVIEIPTITTSGRVDGSRDTIGTRQRNFNNSWTPLTLENHRTWQTLVHPRDIDETNQVASIANITRVFNDEQKFPEMNAYLISKVYSEWCGSGDSARIPDSTVLTADNVLEVFDAMMQEMDENRVPRQGRILYVTPEVRTLINNAKQIYRQMDLKTTSSAIRRGITAIDEVEIPESVPSDMMKTLYDFTEGWAVDPDAMQINMFLVHPQAVITPISYEFAQLDPPSAGSQGKWDYFEESFEDVFVLPHKKEAIAFNIKNPLYTLAADLDIASDFNLLGKVISDLQTGVAIGEDTISGTLNAITGYTGFSGDSSLQSGHYLALHFAVPNAEDATITVELVGGNDAPKELDADGIAILRISNTAQYIKVTASMDGVSDYTRTYKLSGLTLTE